MTSEERSVVVLPEIRDQLCAVSVTLLDRRIVAGEARRTDGAVVGWNGWGHIRDATLSPLQHLAVDRAVFGAA